MTEDPMPHLLFHRFSAPCGLLLVALAAASCTPGNGGDDGSCSGRSDCDEGEACIDGRCEPLPDASLPDAGADGGGLDGALDAGPECTGDDDCGAGVCLSGKCCASEDAVCGNECCAASERCFANSCVTPGAVCHSQADCGEGKFCARELGPSADAGMPGDGGTCPGGAPSPGRCVDLPPRCGEDGRDGDEVCIRECEFRPDFDRLNVETQWHWEATEHPDFTDVWSTPAVGRLYDTNCDGSIDDLDSPNVAFVSGFSKPGQCAGRCLEPSECGAENPGMGSACRRGVLRLLDGKTGRELWSLRRPSDSSRGFMGHSIAIGDVLGDERMEIVAMSGEGRLVIVDGTGSVVTTSDGRVAGWDHDNFGWGGAIALADMNGDGNVEIGYGESVFTVEDGSITRRFDTPSDVAGQDWRTISVFSDVDGDPDVEFIPGRGAFDPDGSAVWDRSGDLPFVFPAVGDFDGDGTPELVAVGSGQVWVLDAATGRTELGPATLPAEGNGGPPTVADFDNDGQAEIGVAQDDYYSVWEADYEGATLTRKWRTANHDFSSSVTGSTVFDFQGDGSAEVIYNDECYLWVYDGATGEIIFSAPTTSFTATEASMVADVDGDGHAEIVMGSNGADPDRWHCNHHTDGSGGVPEWTPPDDGPSYRGITVFRDAENSWVGTRKLWNQHSYHVSNICSGSDSACMPAAHYGAIPERERANWTVPWLNNFRQNVQGEGIFDAPDAVVSLSVECTAPATLRAAVRNLGEALLPAGVEVGFFVREGGSDTMLGTATTSSALFPGEATELTFTAPDDIDPAENTFVAKILIDPDARTFRECDEDNNASDPVEASCLG